MCSSSSRAWRRGRLRSLAVSFATFQIALFAAERSEAVIQLGMRNDGRPSLIYNPTSGNIVLDLEGRQTTGYVLRSDGGYFTGDDPIFTNSISFKTDNDLEISEAPIAPPLGPEPYNLGNVAAPSLGAPLLMSDLSTHGTFAHNSANFKFDLVVVSEPTTSLGLAIGAFLLVFRRPRDRGFKKIDEARRKAL